MLSDTVAYGTKRKDGEERFVKGCPNTVNVIQKRGPKFPKI